jgi:Outer membrane protein beta-barrel domain
MRSISKGAACITLLAALGAVAPACRAQKWELGVLGGGGFYTKQTVSSPSGDGDVGIKSGAALGVFVGNNMYSRIGGELRYEYRPGSLRVASGGTEATFNGESHAIHYDFLIHFTPTGSHIRPFVAAGGGVKIYRGTGTATVTQPLSRLALLTNTYQTSGLGSVGAGVKVAPSKRFGLRFEAHDFITPFPKNVIAPAPGAKISGLLHDFVVMGGFSLLF